MDQSLGEAPPPALLGMLRQERGKEFNRAHKKRQRPSTDSAPAGTAAPTAGSSTSSAGGGKKRGGDKGGDELAPAEIKCARLPSLLALPRRC